MTAAIKKFFQKKNTSLTSFQRELESFGKLNDQTRFANNEIELYPCLNDKTTTTLFDAHYIYHPAWAARIVNKVAPAKHVDISSTLHFSSILSAFITTEFYDFRVAALDLDNLTSSHADLTNLHFPDNSINSLSCMHTLEHIGLGRYGDPIDPDGDLKAIKELMRVCAVGGSLLLVVPVGRQRIMFNAHRIYNAEEFAGYLPGFELSEFSLISDDARFINNASFEMAANQSYGCGCFWFIKQTGDHS